MTLSMEAQEVGNVSPRDFEPPFPVRELPSGVPIPPQGR